jgi:hypothetical protein
LGEGLGLSEGPIYGYITVFTIGSVDFWIALFEVIFKNLYIAVDILIIKNTVNNIK